MGVLVWSPLAGGWLAGRYRRGEDAPKDSRAVRFAEQGRPVARRYDTSLPGNQRKLDVVEELIDLAEKQEMPLQHLALAFVLEHPGVTSAIIGPRTMEQLDGLLSGADVRLPDDVLDRVDELVPPGAVLESADRGWEPPWMAQEARRRR
jgi:aryl-alcohol dehydrogenase-like predicted oxidoreductase